MIPRVSVLMSVYNGEEYLAEAIESILNQTFRDFEFIIINDGSFDSTPSLLAQFQRRDSRILLYQFDDNCGLSSALNFGMEHARGEYIARMDADDISLPNRLQEQVAFMNVHPEVDVCGTWVELIGESTGQVWNYPTSQDTICARMLFANTLVHSSVMMRSAVLRQHNLQYDLDTRYAQDYELWSRAMLMVQFANMDRVLLQHRIHAQSVGAVHHERQYQVRERIYRRILSWLGVEYTTEELGLHQQISMYQYGKDQEFLRRTCHWLEKLAKANQRGRLLSDQVLSEELGAHWTQVCLQSQVQPILLFATILASSLPFHGTRGILKVRCALGLVKDKLQYTFVC